MTVKRPNTHVLLIFPVTERVTRREISPQDQRLLETSEGQAIWSPLREHDSSSLVNVLSILRHITECFFFCYAILPRNKIHHEAIRFMLRYSRCSLFYARFSLFFVVLFIQRIF